MGRVLQITAALVLPLALLLFAQWPLREWVQAYSREANDAAQILFALYAAVAVTVASRRNAHLSTAALATGTQAGARWRCWAILACVGPWAAFMLWAAVPQMLDSVQKLERFPETLNPGYFIIKLSMGVLLLLALLQAASFLWRGHSPRPPDFHHEP
jgi:TRAP-type C4-dicarboxylate transport system permease small subunit